MSDEECLLSKSYLNTELPSSFVGNDLFVFLLFKRSILSEENSRSSGFLTRSTHSVLSPDRVYKAPLLY